MSLVTWQDYFDAVDTFITTNGYVPRYNDFTVFSITDTNQVLRDESDLGQWCSLQRKAYNMGALTQDRIDSLEDIDEWIWEIDNEWTKTLAMVQWFTSIRTKLPDDQSRHADALEENLAMFIKGFKGKKQIPRYKTRFLEQIPEYKTG